MSSFTLREVQTGLPAFLDGVQRDSERSVLADGSTLVEEVRAFRRACAGGVCVERVVCACVEWTTASEPSKSSPKGPKETQTERGSVCALEAWNAALPESDKILAEPHFRGLVSQ